VGGRATETLFFDMQHFSATRPDFSSLRVALAQVLRTYGRERLELEFRLGQATAGRFVPGVSEAGWRRLKRKLDAGQLGPGVVVTDTRELISDDGSGAKYVLTGPEEGYWMHKKRLHDSDADTPATWCCRASLSLEEIDPPERQRAAPAAHRFERHKQRWSYPYKCWSIDLTRVVSNLPHQLDNDGVSYEVEIELRDTSELFVRPLEDVLQWGWCLVKDASDMATPRATS